MNTYKIIKTYLKKEKSIIIISIILGLILTIFATTLTKGYFKNLQSSISKEVIRFHILANSNSVEDQNLKLKVKSEIIKMLEDKLDSSTSKEETKAFLTENLENIKLKALEVIKESGYNYPVSVEISNSYFPTKTYGDISLPAGEYEALKIKIGNAEGKNWWCVMFPPLCFVDVTMKKVPEKDKELLKNILTDEEYEIVSKESSKKPSVKIKFKLLEIFNKE